MSAWKPHSVLLLALAAVIASHAAPQTSSPAAVPPPRIISPPTTHALPEEQKFVYSVQWHMLNAGTTTMSLRRTGSGEHLTSTADTLGIVNKIFPVHDTFEADFDPRTFCTSRIYKHGQEGSRRLDRKIVFNYAHGKTEVDLKDLKSGKSKHSEFDIPACVTDVVSGFFYAGSLPLAPGFIEVFPVNDGGKTTDVRMDVEAREPVKVPAGNFATLKVRAQPINGPLKGNLWVWVTDDARHLPVQMKSKLGFATLFFQLQRIETPPR